MLQKFLHILTKYFSVLLRWKLHEEWREKSAQVMFDKMCKKCSWESLLLWNSQNSCLYSCFLAFATFIFWFWLKSLSSSLLRSVRPRLINSLLVWEGNAQPCPFLCLGESWTTLEHSKNYRMNAWQIGTKHNVEGILETANVSTIWICMDL